jgi:hypothetical protein
VLIQVISCRVAPTAPRMCGSATLTIEESIAPISVPKLMETVTIHLLTGARRAVGASTPGGAGSAAVGLLIDQPPP